MYIHYHSKFDEYDFSKILFAKTIILNLFSKEALDTFIKHFYID